MAMNTAVQAMTTAAVHNEFSSPYAIHSFVPSTVAMETFVLPASFLRH